MAYGLQSIPRALEAVQPLPAAPKLRTWRTLDSERRLALIEQSLSGFGIRDGYPLAL
jgi:hypothetical protein